MSGKGFSDADYATLIPIRQMERAVKFYTETLGGKLLERDTGEMKDYFASVKVGKENFWLIVPSSREKRSLAYSCFMVKDIKSTVEDLKSRGVRFQKAEKMSKKTRIEGPIAYDEWGAGAFFKDSEGNLLMLWQQMM